MSTGERRDMPGFHRLEAFVVRSRQTSLQRFRWIDPGVRHAERLQNPIEDVQRIIRLGTGTLRTLRPPESKGIAQQADAEIGIFELAADVALQLILRKKLVQLRHRVIRPWIGVEAAAQGKVAGATASSRRSSVKQAGRQQERRDDREKTKGGSWFHSPLCIERVAYLPAINIRPPSRTSVMM